MTVALLGRDLIIGSRIALEAERATVELIRVDSPTALPSAGDVALLLVDWGDRDADWGAHIEAWCASAPDSHRPQVVVFGPHTDLAAHAAARDAHLGPMMARSKLIADLPRLLAAAG